VHTVSLRFAIQGLLAISLAAVAACEPAPAPSVAPSQAPSAAGTPVPTPSPLPEFTGELVSIECPSEIPACEILGVSLDGAVVLLRRAGSFDTLNLLAAGALTDVASPEHEPGTPVFGRLSPDAAFVVFDDAGRLWRHDIEDARVTPIPNLGGQGVQWYVFNSVSTLAALVPEIEAPNPPTQVLEVDLKTLLTRPLGIRNDAEIIFSTTRGLVLQVDASPRGDNSNLQLHVLAADGTESPLFSVGAAARVAVAPDGQRVAWSDDGRVWLVTVDTGEKVEVADARAVVSFSPDGQLLAVSTFDGRVLVAGLDGKRVGELPAGSQVAWVTRP
jgi:hypothetical protein